MGYMLKRRFRNEHSMRGFKNFLLIFLSIGLYAISYGQACTDIGQNPHSAFPGKTPIAHSRYAEPPPLNSIR